MERKDYKLEIVNSLLGNERHVRGLAKELKTNHMLVFRKLKELYSENVVDYREEGKNKIYFLKNSSETKNYIFISENYKLNQLLKRFPDLRKIIEKIQDDNRIKLAVLFGSYAKSLVRKGSDIDVYVDTNKNEIKKDLELIDSRLNVKIGKYNKDNLLIKEIEKYHIIIKGVEKFYERNKFFK